EAFYHVMNNNQNVTIHAGESFGPVSIHQALHRCGANRIGHGVRLEEDQDLMAYVANNRIPLEICLSSNLQSCVIDDLSKHPMRYYLRKGVRVCLNTDNTLFAKTSPLRELRLAVDTFDLTLLETENLLLNGFKSAFMSAQSKGKMIVEVLQAFTALRDKFDLDTIAKQGGRT
ncbi:MAG: adenosine deaminase, partial [Candidatus Krumholzibacteriia bacterium]